MKRFSLALTLLPLIAAIGLYYFAWTGWAADFRATLAPWLPGSELAIGGFPYRMETTVSRPRLAGGDIVRLSATATRARINRGPWQPDLTVVATEAPVFTARVSPVISASLTARTALTSVHVDGGRLVRLSTAAEAAVARLGLFPATFTAASLEVHLRERGGETAAAGSPREAPRGQLVLAGTALRIDGGDPLTLAADLVATGPARLTAYDRWATTGTIEVSLTLADATGEVARVQATLIPEGRTGLRFAGTIETVCPATVAAATVHAPPPSETRLRTPLRLAFEGVSGTMRLTGMPADLATRARRAQLPPCPALRR